jgi:hypothetical protein
VVSFNESLATLTLTDIESSTSLQITSPMGSANLKGCHVVQNIGAVETYQRRYLWVALMEIVEHDAVDKGPPVDPSTTSKTGAHTAELKAIKSVAELTALFKSLPEAVRLERTADFKARKQELEAA